ncbi:MAG: CHASE2 domain-containing protein, partial [Gemmatimonadetes bacterium]|nr:CHASE2 domain-containing protein [Gemmatimonadota bacterium]
MIKGMSASSALGWLPGRLRRWLGRVGLGLLVGTLAGAAILALRGTYPVRVAENKTYDWRVRTFTDRTIADTSIVIVGIDDRSLGILREKLGRWPWPRDVYATLIDYLSYAGAKVVVFDVAFFEPDLERPAGDSAFAASIESSGLVVLPVTFYRDDPEAAERLEVAMGRGEVQEILRRFAVAELPGSTAHLSFQRAEIPPALFSRNARGLGSISFNPDPEDAVSRRERLIYSYRGALYPTLALAAARVVDPDRFGGTVSVTGTAITVGRESIPLDRGRFLIRWRGPYRDVAAGKETYRFVSAFAITNSYEQVLTGAQPDVPPEQLKDKIVLIAPTAAGLLDLRANPFQGNEPGVFLHATILDNLLRGDYLRRAPGWANVGAVAAAALGAAAVV